MSSGFSAFHSQPDKIQIALEWGLQTNHFYVRMALENCECTDIAGRLDYLAKYFCESKAESDQTQRGLRSGSFSTHETVGRGRELQQLINECPSNKIIEIPIRSR